MEMQQTHPKRDAILYWSSQILHEPPFDELLSDFTRPAPFRASDDFLTKWRGLRYLAPPLLQFVFYFRWLFIGPAGSYSRLHVDPAGSAAWNACLEGSKRFVFFEPSVMHDLHEDLSNPAAHKHLFPKYIADPNVIRHKGLEIIASAGDVVYAPPRWPHWVENLEASVSVTENFIRRHPDQYRYFDEALGSAENVQFDASGSEMPTMERHRIKRFRYLAGLAFSIDQALARWASCPWGFWNSEEGETASEKNSKIVEPAGFNWSPNPGKTQSCSKYDTVCAPVAYRSFVPDRKRLPEDSMNKNLQHWMPPFNFSNVK